MTDRASKLRREFESYARWADAALAIEKEPKRRVLLETALKYARQSQQMALEATSKRSIARLERRIAKLADAMCALVEHRFRQTPSAGGQDVHET